MSARWTRTRALLALLGVALMMTGGGTVVTASRADAAGTLHVQITGSGSTWSANALQQWIRNVWSNYQWKITYSESGSTQGRNDFKNGTADFGVSEIPYGIANSNEADAPSNRAFVYMPIVAGGTAFMYNLQIGGKRVTNLRLSGDTVGKIFTGVITRWDDPQVIADNPSLALPAIPIVPVVRSDGSGATAQFSIWMRQEHPDLWDAYCPKVGRVFVNDHCGVTSNYPVVPGTGFVSRAGSNGVAGYVAQPQAVGAITFVEYSYATNSGFPVAKLLNKSGYYTEPTASNVAVALLSAHINEDTTSQNYLTQDLSDVYTSGDPRTYPLSSYSYIILPTALENNFTENKGLTLADFGAYFLCEGQQQAESLGYSPLPINLVQAGQDQIRKIPGGDPAIKGISDCNNPTFTPDGSNKLANEAPPPSECDKQGATQCSVGTGGAKDTPTETSGAPAGSNPQSGGTQNAAGGPAAAESGAGGTSRAGDGAVLSQNAAPVVVNAVPQSLPTTAIPVLPALAIVLAGLAVIMVAALPPILGRRRRRRVLPDPVRGPPIR